MNPLDANYRKLRAQVVPLEKYCAEYRLIEDMVNNVRPFLSHSNSSS